MSFRQSFTIVPLLALAACAVPKPPLAPPPRVAAPAPRPAQPSVVGSDWRDWPLTPGTWTYSGAESGRSVAMFGTGPRDDVFRIICSARDRTITLERVGSPDAQAITIRTTSTARTLPVATTTYADGWPPVMHAARLGVGDPLLDAMGFSRGRFVVEEEAGQRTLVIPAWPEILRVTEDCRG